MLPCSDAHQHTQTHRQAAAQIFERNPGELCTEIVVEDEQTQNRFHYRVQDTPGAPTGPKRTLPVTGQRCSSQLRQKPLMWLTSSLASVQFSLGTLMLQVLALAACSTVTMELCDLCHAACGLRYASSLEI